LGQVLNKRIHLHPYAVVVNLNYFTSRATSQVCYTFGNENNPSEILEKPIKNKN
jgi:predicted membrane chloride channel (bestrophin family)